MSDEPIPMLLKCPECNKRHIDELDPATGVDWATKVHHAHSCQHCGHVWRPAIVATVGVQFLPGFKNGPAPQPMSDAMKKASADGIICVCDHPYGEHQDGGGRCERSSSGGFAKCECTKYVMYRSAQPAG